MEFITIEPIPSTEQGVGCCQLSPTIAQCSLTAELRQIEVRKSGTSSIQLHLGKTGSIGDTYAAASSVASGLVLYRHEPVVVLSLITRKLLE